MPPYRKGRDVTPPRTPPRAAPGPARVLSAEKEPKARPGRALRPCEVLTPVVTPQLSPREAESEELEVPSPMRSPARRIWGSGTPGTADFTALRKDVLTTILSFVPLVTLASACALSKPVMQVAATHGHWRLFVLQGFGAYYADYVASRTSIPGARGDWRRLLIYIQRVHANVDAGSRKISVYPNVLRPTIRLGDEPGWRRRRYHGSVELADNCACIIWENGRYVQVLRVRDGKVLFDIDTGAASRRYFHRIANSQQRLFVATNAVIKMWSLLEENPQPVTLPPPLARPGEQGGWEAVARKCGRPLELLVHKQRLVLFESNCLYIWHTETLEPVATVSHVDAAMPENAPHLEVQWMGQWFTTWQRGLSKCLNVWTLGGELVQVLQSDSVVVQLDVVRVTWMDVRELGHFLLAALDEASVIKIWDSTGFAFVCSFNAGCAKPFDLIITQDFLATVNDNVAANKLEVEFWKLWLTKPEQDEDERKPLRIQRGGPQSIGRGETTKRGDGTREGRALLWRLGETTCCGKQGQSQKERARPCFEMMKRLSLVDIDSYFASYRNFFNVCSYHKNGCESVQVYRSKTLKKKIHFRPAKHTKFEEWIAIQVDLSGTVTIYDFRPGGVAFDEIRPDQSPADPAFRWDQALVDQQQGSWGAHTWTARPKERKPRARAWEDLCSPRRTLTPEPDAFGARPQSDAERLGAERADVEARGKGSYEEVETT